MRRRFMLMCEGRFDYATTGATWLSCVLQGLEPAGEGARRTPLSARDLAREAGCSGPPPLLGGQLAAATCEHSLDTTAPASLVYEIQVHQ